MKLKCPLCPTTVTKENWLHHADKIHGIRFKDQPYLEPVVIETAPKARVRKDIPGQALMFDDRPAQED